MIEVLAGIMFLWFGGWMTWKSQKIFGKFFGICVVLASLLMIFD